MKAKHTSIILLSLLALCLSFVSCGKENEPDIDPREQYVGTYILDVNSDIKLTNGSKTTTVDINAKGKTLIIELDRSSTDKFKVSGYYGNVEAQLIDGEFILMPNETKQYKNGIYIQTVIAHDATKLNNNVLKWESTVIIGSVGVSGGYTGAVTGGGTLYNTATKK